MLKLYWQEAKKNISGAVGHSGAIVLMFTVVFCIVLFCVFTFSPNSHANIIVNSGLTDSYELCGFASFSSSLRMHEVNALPIEERYELVKQLLTDLDRVDGVTLGACFTHQIYVENFLGEDKFLYNYEYGIAEENAVKGLFIYPENFDVEYELSAGEQFDPSDLVWNEDEPLPVMLGYEYTGTYNVGDIIHELPNEDGSYAVSLNGQFKVVGILKEDFLYYLDEEGYISLDRYMLCPFIYPPEEVFLAEEVNYHVKDYLVRFNMRLSTTSIFVEKEKSDEAIAQMREILEECYPYNIYYRISQSDYEGSVADSNLINSFYIILAVILSAFTVVSLLYAMRHTVQKNIRDFSQHMCLGSTRRDIANIMGLHVGALLLIADGITLILAKFVINDTWIDTFRVSLCVGIVGGLNILLILAAWLIAYFSMPSKNISDIIK